MNHDTLRAYIIPVKQGDEQGKELVEMLALHVNYMLNLSEESNADHGGLCNGHKSSPPPRGEEKKTV